MSRTQLLLAALAALATSACATKAAKIPTQYVSPMVYEHYDCDQLRRELQRVNQRVSSLGAQIDKNVREDKVATGVGMILFWPALFFIDGDGPEANEYARLKGEHEALQVASVEKRCGYERETMARD